MSKGELWYREVLGFLAEQDTQGFDEDDFVHMKSPGKYPYPEEMYPEMPEKDAGGKEDQDSGSVERAPTFSDLFSYDSELLQRVFDLASERPHVFRNMAKSKTNSEVFGVTISPSVAKRILRYTAKR